MSEPRVAIVPPGTGKYRLRLPREFASQLGWPQPEKGFQCFGYFRTHGELLCVAQELELPERISALRKAMTSAFWDPAPPETFGDVPDAAQLVAAPRVIEFRAIWLKPPHTQLELQLSAPVLARLGWHAGSSASLAALAYSRVLMLLSEQRYADAHTDLGL